MVLEKLEIHMQKSAAKVPVKKINKEVGLHQTKMLHKITQNEKANHGMGEYICNPHI